MNVQLEYCICKVGEATGRLQ